MRPEWIMLVVFTLNDIERGYYKEFLQLFEDGTGEPLYGRMDSPIIKLESHGRVFRLYATSEYFGAAVQALSMIENLDAKIGPQLESARGRLRDL